MQQEYDFSKGERGKFFRKNAKLNFPIYLEPEVRNFIEKVASKKGLDVGTIVNKMIKTQIQLVEDIS